MILYSYFRSSASFRVRMALDLKGLEYEYRAVHLLKAEQRSDDYAKVNPSREVPSLVHDGRTIAQSVAIIDYLDHVKPEPALFPRDPFRRALVMQACEIVNSGTQPVYNLRVLGELEKRFHADDAAKKDWARHWLTYGMTALEALLKPHAGTYSFGNEPSAADCFVMSQWMGVDRFEVDPTPYPTLIKIRKTCEQLDAYRKAAFDNQPDSPPKA